MAKTEMAVFGAQKVLVVERFDRQWMGERWIARLPQEDFCQALAVPPDRKYEHNGGPGMEDALKLLSGSASPNADRERFLLAQCRRQLSPDASLRRALGLARYRTRCQFTFAQKARLAMRLRAKNMHYRLREIRARHYREMADKSGVPAVWDRMLELVNNVPPSLAAVEKRLAPDFPRILWERISNGMLSQAANFKNETLGSGIV